MDYLVNSNINLLAAILGLEFGQQDRIMQSLVKDQH